MSEIYLAVYSLADLCLAPIETIVVLFTIKYCESSIGIKLVLTRQKSNERAYMIDLTSFIYEIISTDEIPCYANLCELPNVVIGEHSYMAGLCTVLRHIVKDVNIVNHSAHHCQKLLGFKDSCLMTCSETSVWTKFCEIELISTLKTLNPENLELPITLIRFEHHMSQPVKLHNICKYTKSKKFVSLNIPLENNTNLPEHTYAESPYITLIDIVIFVCIHLLLTTLSSEMIQGLIPFTTKWYNRMMADQFVAKCLNCLSSAENYELSNIQYVLPVVVIQSLYKSNLKKCNTKKYTKQENIEHSLKLIEDVNISTELSAEPFGIEINMDWSVVPFDATPEGGSLPLVRQNRKQEQLQNLCKPVLKLAKAGDTIVDFCSGSGHLGILIAFLLPHCTVIVLDNKEESLGRAKKRVASLNLKNIKICQCNLDYFKGDFNIGTSLHACGVATDLIIRCCIQKNAIFISCPCCYGLLQDCHHLTYPRSEIFKKNIDNREYSYISHAADQTHDEENIKTKQGYKCMTIIDTDRKLYAEQFDYEVYLGKLFPETCTPKNNLLVGIPKDQLLCRNICEN